MFQHTYIHMNMCVMIVTKEKEVIKVRVRKQERGERDGIRRGWRAPCKGEIDAIVF